jgi:predicted transcriptional regulator YheO
MPCSIEKLKLKILFYCLEKIYDSLSKIVGPNCELVLHDLRKPVDQTIIQIKNGHITGRKIGGALARLGANYIKTKDIRDLELDRLHVTNGKIIKANLCLFYDDEDNPVAMLSLLFNVTQIVKQNEIVREIIGIPQAFSKIEQSYLLFSDAQSRIVQFADEILAKYDTTQKKLKKQDKLDILTQLYNSGFFNFKGSINIISRKLGSSKYTVYSYLNKIKSGKIASEEI